MNTYHKPLPKIALFVTLLLGSQGLHQELVSQPNPEPANPATTSAAPELGPELPIKKTNDPFANTLEMLKQVSENNPVTSTLSALTGSLDMRLRGAVIDGDGNSLALLELGNGQVHVVRVGDTVSLKTSGNNSSVKIIAIHRQSVELEFGDFEDFIVIR